MEKVSIAIEKRVSLAVLDLAICATLEGHGGSEYFAELASTECTGANRAKKIVALLNRLTVRCKLLPFMQKHKEETIMALHNKNDKGIMFTAVMCSSYSLFYDTINILGKYLHVQQQVGRNFLIQKLAEKYGSNRALDVAFDCVMPMLIEAGVVKRPAPGVYEIVRQEKISDFARLAYKQAFLVNNPTYSESDDVESQSFFEFTR